MNFLIIDDNPDDRELLIQTLKKNYPDAGYTEVSHRKQLDEALESGAFDIVFTDYRLNWTDGLRVLSQFKARHPQIPVIMVTDTGNEEIAVQGMKAGLSYYVLKKYLFQISLSVKETLEKEALRKEVEAVQKGLREAHALLETRVEERTEALLQANHRLKREIAERSRAEEGLKQKTEEAEEANRSKSHFLSTVSHELRTPLNAIIGYTSLLIEGLFGPLSEHQIEPLKGIRRNAEEQLRLVNDLLDLGKIESRKMSVEIEAVDLPALIRDVYLGMKPLFEKKSLDVTWQIEEGLPVIQSDPYKIRQVITNLLSNALKFTPEGGLTLSAGRRPDHSGIILTVRDTGIGIPPEELPKIFNAFHQVDGTMTREFGGVGLGLAIVKELVALLKGEIGVESTVGKGTTFIVSLPDRLH